MRRQQGWNLRTSSGQSTRSQPQTTRSNSNATAARTRTPSACDRSQHHQPCQRRLCRRTVQSRRERLHLLIAVGRLNGLFAR